VTPRAAPWSSSTGLRSRLWLEETSPALAALVSSRLDEVTAEVRLWHGEWDVVSLDRAEFVAQAPMVTW
jgi:hypothetical protein